VPPADLRSGDEEAFQKSFIKNAPHWNLVYEGALVVLEEAGRKRLMVPDFVARSPRSSTEVLIEIVGFWRKDYLERKIGKVRLIMNRRLALIVNSTLSVSREELTAPNAEGVRILFYANRDELKQAAKTLAEELEGIP
jgi:predicted nuclease of restriction endonuclease-like RecB superfamily